MRRSPPDRWRRRPPRPGAPRRRPLRCGPPQGPSPIRRRPILDSRPARPGSYSAPAPERTPQRENGATGPVPMPLKVLLVSLFHPELVRGGAQQVCYELFQGLKQQAALQPYLLSSVDSGYPALFKSGARITGFDGRPSEFLFLCRDYDYWWHKTGDPQLIEGYADFLEQIRPDIVHFHHFLTFGVDVLTLTRRVLPQAKIVLTFHEF